jgi:hypothetical protein
MAESSQAESGGAHFRESVRTNRAIWWTAGVLLAALVVVILWKVPQWQVGHLEGLTSREWFDRVNEARKTLATVLGGLVLLAGGFATWRNLKLAQESLRVSQDGQITDRFSKAIEQLGAVDASGKMKLEVRLGGIYALERIANQSQRDHWPIMEVLSAYVRQNASPVVLESKYENQNSFPTGSIAEDIQAILTVLGRRDRKYREENQELNLFSAHLPSAYLPQANFSRANLMSTSLHGAYLGDADLSEAKFRRANLGEAFIYRANLRGADLFEADLSDARLHGADLRDTLNLTQQQLDKAKGDSATQLPRNLHMPEQWATE